jgi:hypothetical protein
LTQIFAWSGGVPQPSALKHMQGCDVSRAVQHAAECVARPPAARRPPLQMMPSSAVFDFLVKNAVLSQKNHNMCGKPAVEDCRGSIAGATIVRVGFGARYMRATVKNALRGAVVANFNRQKIPTLH